MTLVTIDISQLSDDQVIEFYSKHHLPTVRALAERLKIAHQSARVRINEAYQEGWTEALTEAAKIGTISGLVENPQASIEDELRVGKTDW